MIGLAMRTALSRIGAAGQSIKHLIIDEGFGCCDSNNIQRAQQIVRELMMRGQYKSIILMSHLDAIRDVSQSSINIKRDSGKFSYIQFGNPPKKYKKIKNTCNGNTGIENTGNSNVNVETIEPKPRGRPRKTVNKAI
jgi:ABC-type polysaccharide/polyol phosphate transport system ATPase subunit